MLYALYQSSAEKQCGDFLDDVNFHDFSLTLPGIDLKIPRLYDAKIGDVPLDVLGQVFKF